MAKNYVKFAVKAFTCLSKGILRFGNDTYVSFSAELVGPGKVKLGRHVSIEPHARLCANGGRAYIEIGDHSTILPYALLKTNGGTIKIGAHCSVNDYSVINGLGGVTIGDHVHIASHVYIVSSEHDYNKLGTEDFSRDMLSQGVSIEDNVWIGAGAVVLDGVTIGTGSVIGAGAVVTKNIEPYSLAVGVPARVTKKIK